MRRIRTRQPARSDRYQLEYDDDDFDVRSNVSNDLRATGSHRPEARDSTRGETIGERRRWMFLIIMKHAPQPATEITVRKRLSRAATLKGEKNNGHGNNIRRAEVYQGFGNLVKQNRMGAQKVPVLRRRHGFE